ncbi:MAG: aminotransferase, partial [Thermoprotei archaeon]
FPEGCRWTRPVGGMFIFAYLPEKIDTSLMLEKAKQKKVAYVPGRSFFVDGSGWNTMRLNFTFVNEEKIEEGIRRLAELIKEEL